MVGISAPFLLGQTAYFQGLLLLVSGRVTLPKWKTWEVGDCYSYNHGDFERYPSNVGRLQEITGVIKGSLRAGIGGKRLPFHSMIQHDPFVGWWFFPTILGEFFTPKFGEDFFHPKNGGWLQETTFKVETLARTKNHPKNAGKIRHLVPSLPKFNSESP